MATIKPDKLLSRWSVIVLTSGFGVLAGLMSTVAWRWMDPPSFSTFDAGIAIYSTGRLQDPWVPSLTTVGGFFCVVGAVLGALVGAVLAWWGWSISRDKDTGPGALMVLFAVLGLVLGLLAAVAILALPFGFPASFLPESLTEISSVQFRTADVIWWLLPLVSAAIGAGVAGLVALSGWKLRHQK
ncbi:hypothetical protein CBI38_29300 [Rhodococcus oxybenzonivorans]|uniref:Uncharacterized protein n=1 Tax=Rhodococcus oxybenzonivorans TaxID=1990687 RepID=A0A2S2C2F9_9NOCA|nr:hypothetical protein [Rhodococcus oxybenzonivorans]AWK75040.1 hypothetical protein CBI38_29300 [Rhodococcus oxybenzonivorans]